MCSSQPLAGLESLIRVRQTQSAFHRSAQRNAFRHLGARLQQRSFARENPRLRRSPNSNPFCWIVGDDIPNISSYVERGSFP